MNIIFPMLGLGSRFKKAGFLLPKYLLDLAEEKILYFVLYGFRNLNRNKFIFLIRYDQRKYFPDKEIKRICDILKITNFNIVEVKQSTKGQADSVRYAFKYCDIKDPILIFNIDTIHLDLKPFFNFEYDGMMETFYAEGNHWSFAKVNSGNLIYEVQEKKRISDHCSNGLYYFRNYEIFNYCYEKLYKKINTNYSFELKEDYIAPMYNVLIEEKKPILNRSIESQMILPAGVPSEYFDLCKRFKKKIQLESLFKKY